MFVPIAIGIGFEKFILIAFVFSVGKRLPKAAACAIMNSYNLFFKGIHELLRSVPLLRGVEGCVIEDVGEHTPATTSPGAPPLKRGVVLTNTLSIEYNNIAVSLGIKYIRDSYRDRI